MTDTTLDTTQAMLLETLGKLAAEQEKTATLTAAGQAVLDNWETGDLAGAVQELAAELENAV